VKGISFMLLVDFASFSLPFFFLIFLSILPILITLICISVIILQHGFLLSLNIGLITMFGLNALVLVVVLRQITITCGKTYKYAKQRSMSECTRCGSAVSAGFSLRGEMNAEQRAPLLLHGFGNGLHRQKHRLRPIFWNNLRKAVLFVESNDAGIKGVH
jgi:hypothetical protein